MTTDGLKDSPARHLAVELVAKIFLLCLPSGGSSRSPAWTEPFVSDAPLLLCRVCSLWRCIALSTPMLWSSIILDCIGSSRSNNRAPRKMKAVNHWIQFSKPHPISIMIRNIPQSGDMVKMIDTLLPIISRLKELHILNVRITRTAVQQLFYSISSGAPHLEILCVSLADFVASNTPATIPRLPLRFTSFPRLSKLTIIYPLLDIVPGISVPEKNFSIQIERASFENCLQVMMTIPSLRNLGVEIFSRGSLLLQTTLPLSPPFASLLSSLQIKLNPPYRDLPSFLRSIELPNLQELEIVYICTIEECDPTQVLLPEFLVRSKCDLKRLTVQFEHQKFGFADTAPSFLVPSTETLSLPQATANLKYLSIRSNGLTPLLNHLAPAQDHVVHEIAWPHLKELKLEIRPISYGMLENIIIRRNANVRDLAAQIPCSKSIYDITTDEESTKIVLSGVHKALLPSHPDHVRKYRKHDVRFITSWDDETAPQTVDEYMKDIQVDSEYLDETI